MVKRARDVLNPPFRSNFLQITGEACLVGLITGLVVSAFRWIIDQTLTGLQWLYPLMRSHLWMVIPYLLIMIVICWLLGIIIHPYLVDMSGSGVPQIEEQLAGGHHMNWWPVMWRKFIGGLLAICPGLFLGREGPCIQMGAAIGQGLGENVFNDPHDQSHRFLVTCGVAAGLSAAFSAPVAGTMFLIEEMIFRFKPRIWLTALAAAICADLVTLVVFGTKPCLYLPIKINLPLASYPELCLLGVVIGILAYCYQYCLLNLRWWFRGLTFISRQYQSIIPLILVIPIGLWHQQLLGGSHLLINAVAHSEVTASNYHQLIMTMGIFLIIRFIFSMISYGTGVPGGIFMPILTLGALIGAIAASLLIQSSIIPGMAFVNITAISMAAYFGAIEHAPFTAILLLTEMIGSVEQVLPMTLVTFVAYVMDDLLGGRPIYTALREEIFA